MVDKERCDERHDGIRWRFRGIYWLIGIATVVVGSSGWAGFSAKHSLEVHEQVQIETEKSRDETLKRIETAVEKIWTHIHGEPP